MSSLVPRRRCTSFQNAEVNLVSRSDTMDSATPCRRTISRTYNHASSDALIVVTIGIRCVCEVSRHKITQR